MGQAGSMREGIHGRPRTLLRSEECSALKFHPCFELTPREYVDGLVSKGGPPVLISPGAHPSLATIFARFKSSGHFTPIPNSESLKFPKSAGCLEGSVQRRERLADFL